MKAMTDSVSGAVEIDKFSFENEDLWSKVSFGLPEEIWMMALGVKPGGEEQV